jgi:hypothetical protein
VCPISWLSNVIGAISWEHAALGSYMTLSGRPNLCFISFILTKEQVTFPNGLFSGTIISSVIHDGNIKRTAEWQLLLGAIALPGVFVGAMLCNPLGRRNTVCEAMITELLEELIALNR